MGPGVPQLVVEGGDVAGGAGGDLGGEQGLAEVGAVAAQALGDPGGRPAEGDEGLQAATGAGAVDLAVGCEVGLFGVDGEQAAAGVGADVRLQLALVAVDDVAEPAVADAGQLGDAGYAEAGAAQPCDVGADQVGVDEGAPSAVGEVAVA